jgi:hypothetical protein
MGYDSSMAGLAAQYASCSSVTTDYLPEITAWNYTYCVSAQRERKYVQDLSFVERRDKNLLALFLYDQQRDLIVLSFRATVCGSNTANGKTDLNMQFKLYREWGCRFGLCHAHTGFLNSYDLMREEIRATAKELTARHPSARFLVTGLSLGGALAALASYDVKMYLKSQGVAPQFLFYTFGQPRIGNYYLVREINRETTIYRVVDAADPVPHLPPRKLPESGLAYFHPGVEVYYDDMDSSSFSLCAGDNDKCSLKRQGLYEVCNHLYYPLMSFEGNGCQVRNSKFNFGITEVETLQENEHIVGFFLHECKLTCLHIDPMMCPYYRIPELHCEPLEIKTNLLWNLLRLITPANEIERI